MTSREAALLMVGIERERQDEEFGPQTHDAAYWYAILGKQFGQLGEAIVQAKWASSRPAVRTMTEEKMYHEATQVAAVAVALMEALLNNDLPNEITTARPRDPRQAAKAMGIGDEQLQYDDVAPAFPPLRGTEDVQLPTEDAEVVCGYCGRDNRNSTHSALERVGHLSHPFNPDAEPGPELGGK